MRCKNFILPFGKLQNITSRIPKSKGLIFFPKSFLSKHRCTRFNPVKLEGKIFFCLCLERYIIMRRELENILGEELRFLAIETRDRLDLTQREMGKELHMSESSYSDIETGRSTCGVLTATLLLNMQDNPKVFLQKVAKKFSEWYDKEMQSV